ncbi:DUF2029 domain-containing protein [bacterium]|nr:DUF2029 domain-containing protein [bacterium]MBU1025005.1 DUF2029 domain-containing protein [bacterium]
MERRRKKRAFRMWFHPLILCVVVTIFIRYDVYHKIMNIETDFPNYYTASRMMLENRNLSNIYNNREFQKQADLYCIENNIVSFVPHTPPSMLFYMPVAFFQPDTAKKIWTFLNFCFLSGSVLLLFKTFEMRLHHVAFLSLTFVAPVLNNFMMGQAYLCILFLISLGLYLWRSDKQLLSGIVLGAATSFKPFPGFLIIPALLSKKWKITIGMIIGFLIPHFVILLISPEIYHPYLNYVLPATLSGNIQNPFHIAFRSYSVILRNLFIADPARNPTPLLHSPFLFMFLKFLIALLIIHLFSFIHILSIRNEKTYSIYSVSFFLAASLLIAPISSSYQYVLLIPAMLALVKKLGRYQIPGVINLHTYYIFSLVRQIPFIELVYMTIFSITSLIAVLKNQQNFMFKRALVWGIPVVILSLIGSLLLSPGFDKYDNAEYVSELTTTGFPGELKIDGDNIFFTEIMNGNYVIDYNNTIIKLDGYDLFNPTPVTGTDENPVLICQAYGNGRENFAKYSLNQNEFIELREMTDVDYPKFKATQTPDSNDIFFENKQLTSHPARDYSPAYKSESRPDGTVVKYVYFISERGGGLNDGRFYRIRIDD